MNEETMLKEILNALKLHGEQMNKKFAEVDERFVAMERKFEKKFAEMDEKFEKRFDDMDKRFDRLEKKVDGIRADLTDTQEITNFLLSRSAKHEEKIRNLTTPQN